FPADQSLSAAGARPLATRTAGGRDGGDRGLAGRRGPARDPVLWPSAPHTPDSIPQRLRQRPPRVRRADGAAAVLARRRPVPVLGNLLPARQSLYALLASGLLLAVFAAATLQWRRTAIGPALLIGASLICLMPRLPMPVQTIEIPSFFTGTDVKTIPEGSVA